MAVQLPDEVASRLASGIHAFRARVATFLFHLFFLSFLVADVVGDGTVKVG